MQPWTLLDSAPIPGSRGDLRLLQRGQEFSIRLAGGELMNSRVRGSEEALARLGCAQARMAERASVLVGGYGMGFTLRAALDLLDASASVTVAELVPAVLTWGRGPLASLSANSLDDPRVIIHEGDVGHHIRSAHADYHAILLDVDNGPQGLTRESNDGLYGSAGLAMARRALRPGGVLAVWSAAPDPAFSQRLRRTGFRIEEVALRANGKRGVRHLIWLATSP